MKSFDEIVAGFNTTPFLFIGSGFSRRYCNLPDWNSLLMEFAARLSDDEYTYGKYCNMARVSLKDPNADGVDLFPEVASQIEKDFNERWYADKSFRRLANKYKQNGQLVSPFKCEIAQYIDEQTNILEERKAEFEKFMAVTHQNITGIITTNYDTLLDDIPGYKVFSGQNDLIFSNLQTWAEVYKIHGSVTIPESLVLTSSDYKVFEENEAYLASKLMTIFMEYPVVFLGYSINDKNIAKILEHVTRCMSKENREKLKERLVYVEWKEGAQDIMTAEAYFRLNGNFLQMTKISTDNFGKIYDILGTKKATIPVGLARMFREEIYTFITTHQPTQHIMVAEFDEEKLTDDNLVMAFGDRDTMSSFGVKSIQTADWNRHVVLKNLNVSADTLFKEVYRKLYKSGLIAVNRLLKEATIDCSFVKENMAKSFDSLCTNSIIKHRYPQDLTRRSIKAIREDFEGDILKITDKMCHLREDEIDVEDLEEFLIEIWQKNEISQYPQLVRTNLNRLTTFWDYLKYGKKEE